MRCNVRVIILFYGLILIKICTKAYLVWLISCKSIVTVEKSIDVLTWISHLRSFRVFQLIEEVVTLLIKSLKWHRNVTNVSSCHGWLLRTNLISWRANTWWIKLGLKSIFKYQYGKCGLPPNFGSALQLPFQRYRDVMMSLTSWGEKIWLRKHLPGWKSSSAACIVYIVIATKSWLLWILIFGAFCSKADHHYSRENRHLLADSSVKGDWILIQFCESTLSKSFRSLPLVIAHKRSLTVRNHIYIKWLSTDVACEK